MTNKFKKLSSKFQFELLLYLLYFKFKLIEDRRIQYVNYDNCIIFKGLTERNLNYIQEKYSEKFNEINTINKLVIGFSDVEEKFKVDIYDRITLKEEFKRKLYKFNELVAYIPKNLNKFTKYLN